MCTIKIGSVTATESGGQVTSVTITGEAAECQLVSVTFTCQGQQLSKTVPVGGGGIWETTFDASDNLVVAECECDGPVRVEAACVGDPGCRDSWEGRLDCRDERRCEIKITSVMGTESGGQVTSVRIEGKAVGCSQIKVSFTCQGNILSKVVPANPGGGDWKAVFDASDKLVVAECECDGPVRVEAICVDDPNCADTWEGRLECDEERRCEVKVTAVLGTESGGQVTSVTVLGTAVGCSQVKVSFTCQGQVISEVASVDPGGNWKALFDASDKLVVAECECNGPVRVEAICVDHPNCSDRWEGRLDCEEEQRCEIKITSVKGTEFGGQVISVTVAGKADGCDVVNVSFTCQGAVITEVTPVDPTTGTWKAVFDGEDKLVVAECECDGPARVEAVCVDHPNCADKWEGRLDCEKVGDPCEIKITSVKGKATGGEVTSVTVEGKAANCGKIEVTFTCQGQLITEGVTVEADGTWKSASGRSVSMTPIASISGKKNSTAT